MSGWTIGITYTSHEFSAQVSLQYCDSTGSPFRLLTSLQKKAGKVESLLNTPIYHCLIVGYKRALSRVLPVVTTAWNENDCRKKIITNFNNI